MKARIAVALLVAFSLGATARAVLVTDQVTGQPCKWEDEILVGRGDFVQGKGWDRWVCIAADDLSE